MTSVKYVLVLLLLAPCLFAQNNGNKIISYKHYDTTVIEDTEKILRRRMKTDVEENGFSVYVWKDSYFKLNFINNLGLNINKRNNIIKNGEVAYSLGNNNYSFIMYKTNTGFEYDAVLKKKPPNGIHEITFDIETRNLLFLFQDTLMDFEKLTSKPRADSVIYSYAVRRIDGRQHNYSFKDIKNKIISSTNYGTGKAFHIYRPKAWDASGDIIWGYMDIDTILNQMTVGVDSIWLLNASYPVTIDPTFGNTSIGGTTGGAFADFLYAFRAITSTDADGGQIDSVNAYIFNHSGAPSNMIWGLYDEDGGDTADVQISVQSSGEAVTTSTPAWQSFKNAFSSISGGLSNSTVYFITQLSDESSSGNITSAYDNGVPKFVFSTAYKSPNYPVLPDPWGIATNSANRNYSVYVSFTVPAVGDEISPRKNKIDKVIGGINEEIYHIDYFVVISDYR